MPMLNDKTCAGCQQELKWVGSIMEGKMECTNPFCKEKFDFSRIQIPAGGNEGTFEQDIAMDVDSCNLKGFMTTHAINATPPVYQPNPVPAAQPPLTDSQILARWSKGLVLGHRIWCESIANPSANARQLCNCGWIIGSHSKLSDKEIIANERKHYGDY